MSKNIEASRYIRKSSAVSAKIGEEVVILEIGWGVYYSRNNSGNEIWKILAEPVTVEEIMTRLCEIYDMPQDEGLRSIMTLLNGLETAGLVEKASVK